MTEIEKKTGMTDAECENLDVYYTNNAFEPGPNLLKQSVKPGFAHNTLLLNEPGNDIAEYVRSQANALHKTPAEIISELVREKIAASAL
jgi:hypothetical protein